MGRCPAGPVGELQSPQLGWAAHDTYEPGPLLIVANGDRQPLVVAGTRIHALRGGLGRAVTPSGRGRPGHGRFHDGVTDVDDHVLDLRHLHYLAAAGPAPLQKGHEERVGSGRTARGVHKNGTHRRPIDIALHLQEAAELFEVPPEAGGGDVRA